MVSLNKEELSQIIGGAKIGIWVGLASFVTFLIGVVDGYVRKLSCR